VQACPLGNEVPVERALRQTVGAGNSGSFQFSGLATCWYALRATAPGWAPAYDGPFLLKAPGAPELAFGDFPIFGAAGGRVPESAGGPGGAGSDGGEVIHHLVLRRPVWAGESRQQPPRR
jgi:hypothetical protein